MSDKYIAKIDGVYYIRLRPPACWNYDKAIFSFSLRTGDIRTARRLRDKYLLPILAESRAVDMVRTIGRLLATQDLDCQLDEFREAVGHEDSRSMILISELFSARIAALKKGDASKSTIDTYEVTRSAFTRIIGDTAASLLTFEDFKNWRDKILTYPKHWMRTGELTGEPLVSSATVKNRLDNFSYVWAWGVSEQLIDNKPFPGAGLKIESRASGSSSDKNMTRDEVELAIAIPWGNSTVCTEREWSLIPMIARYTGLRLAEIAQLRGEDIIERDGILCFDINDDDGKILKNKSSRRIVPIADKLLPLIDSREGFLFPLAASTARPGRGLGDLFNRRAKKIGKHIHFHSFRSYFITELANAGCAESDRMRLAGHSASIHAGYTADDMKRFKKFVDKVY